MPKQRARGGHSDSSALTVERLIPRPSDVESVPPSDDFDLVRRRCRWVPFLGHRHKDSFPPGLVADVLTD